MTQFKDKARRLARESYWEIHDRECYECPDCGRTEDEIRGTFEVHHKNGEPMDNRPENRIGLCRVCHNLREDKKPSIKDIRHLRDNGVKDTRDEESGLSSNSEVRSVYLAGTMTYHGDDSYWTASVKDDASTVATWREVIRDFGPLTVNSPKDLHFNHGADLVAGVAGSDIELLQESDAILAYFDKKEQVGTLTELMHAIHNNKPALVLFSSNLVVPPAVDPFEEVNRSYQWIGGTIGMRFESPVYWFLVNFLLGDSDEVAVDSSWDGVASNVRAAVVADTNGIQQAYLEWAESVIKRFTRTECEQQ